MSDQTSVSAPGLVDTHCHLDADAFDTDRAAVVRQAVDRGVETIVVPAVGRENFAKVEALCKQHPECRPAYGIHPLFVGHAQAEDLDFLRETIVRTAPVAVGEIGLDFFIDNPDVERQEFFLAEQLKIARDHGLPVILHVRRAVDAVLKQLRRIEVCGGIAHAFNGSRQQADIFVSMGFRLGFGGAMTFERARRIRDLAQYLPLEAIVLETDAPDIPPAWISRGRNTSAELPQIAGVLARLRGEREEVVRAATTRNAEAVFPRLRMG
jgi:TatD DNase family protein